MVIGVEWYRKHKSTVTNKTTISDKKQERHQHKNGQGELPKHKKNDDTDET